VKSLIAFSHLILQDLGDRCHTSTIRDIKTVTERVEHEGISFLTISLPTFNKAFLRSLEEGCIVPNSFPSFKGNGAGLPSFLRGFLEQVFDSKTGVLLENPSVDAIFSIHQFTSMFGKMRELSSERRIHAAMAGLVECESDVIASNMRRSQAMLDDFMRVAQTLFRNLFTSLDLAVWEGELIPKHGPGATAEKLSSNAKYTHLEWTSRLEEYFPSGEHLFPNWGWYPQSRSVTFREPEDELPVRVIAVPKTMKTPRIIAIEPVYMQYVQQGLFEAITARIQGSDTLRNLLGYLDQEPNRHLARKGSRDGSLATLDLSEASDRVSNQLVQAMLQNHPHLRRAVDACRSRTADVPGHGIIPLAKFASMGSALCFPIEAIVFTTLVFLGIERATGRRLSSNSVRSYLGRVRVYGDDIIVPVDMVSSVIGTLEDFGLKVNRGKSFWNGKFRESCGGDYFDGQPITPVKVRRHLPTSRKHVDELVSTVSLRNHLFEAGGFDRAVRYLDDLAGKLLPVYPEVPRNSPGIGRWSHSPIVAERHHPTLHKPLVKACVARTVLPKDPLDGHGALMKWFLKRGDLPFAARDHLQRAGRPESVDIKLRWVALDERVTASRQS